MHHNSPPESFNSLIVQCARKKHEFLFHEVVRLEAKSNYTVIHTINKKTLTVAKVLAEYEKMLLGKGFIRVHCSHIINQQHMQGLDVFGNVVLIDNLKVKVSRRKKKSVRLEARLKKLSE